MTKREQAFAQLFARLASIPLPAEGVAGRQWALNEFERQGRVPTPPEYLDGQLEREWAALESDYVRLAKPRIAGRIDAKRESAWEAKAMRQDLPLLLVHVRTILWPLLHGEKVSQPFEVLGTAFVWRLQGNVLTQEPDQPTPLAEFHASFVRLAHVRPFLYRCCPRCQRVFVRVKRQVYCSQVCRTASLEAARKGKRREYMKTYMATRRARERARARREGR
jgi:hypothetical protein